MDTGNTQQTWLTGSHEEGKTSMAAYAKSRERYRDSPNPVKSRADIILTEIEKQLEATESEYVSAMERLQYSKLLYDTAGSMSLSTSNYNRTDESLTTKKNPPVNVPSDNSLVDNDNCEQNFASGDAKFFAETNDTQLREREDVEHSPVYTARSRKIASGSNIFNDNGGENTNIPDEQNHFRERAKAERTTNSTYKSSMENYTVDNANYIREELSTNDTLTRRLEYPYQLHLEEYSKSLQEELEEESRNAGPPKMEDREIYSSEKKSSPRRDFEKPELTYLKLSGSLDSVQTSRSKRNRKDKQRRVISKIVSKSIDETVGATSKRKRKKRGGIKTSNSRCTTATRDTSISENKKDIRKRKSKGPPAIARQQAFRSRRQDVAMRNNRNSNMSEVVEIYHNSALKSGSLSVVSSKHSKLMETRARGFNANKIDQPSRTKGSYRLVENADQNKRIFHDIVEQGCKKEADIRCNQSSELFEKLDENFEENLDKITDFRSPESNRAECSAVDEAVHKTDKDCSDHNDRQDVRSPNILTSCYDPLSTRNYELPTVSSTMKKVHRSYFNRFNFRHIPFVVGTSVTPSYNLGLNIQEALSLMKGRQMIHTGVSPMLISSVSRGIKPVSTLLRGVGNVNESLAEQATTYDLNSGKIADMWSGQLSNGKMSRSIQFGPNFPLKTSRLSCIVDTQNLCEIEESCIDPKVQLVSKRQKTRSICSSMKFEEQRNVGVPPELTQSTLLRQRQEELQNCDSHPMTWQSGPENSKGIREVLMNFHDQYEAMILKFENVQQQAKKTGDRSLEREIASLEKELNVKENEINAVASLYQEVMMLKQQMRLLHERNSLVCVATELSGGPASPYFSISGRTANPTRAINLYRRDGTSSHQGPPPSTKLAGLLRQIKTFQKQLKSAT